MQTQKPASRGDGSRQTVPVPSFILDLTTHSPTHREGDQGPTTVQPLTLWGHLNQSQYMLKYFVSK